MQLSIKKKNVENKNVVSMCVCSLLLVAASYAFFFNMNIMNNFLYYTYELLKLLSIS